MTPRDFVAALEAGRDFQVLDVRAPQRLESGRIDIVPESRFVNVRGSELLAREDLQEAGLDPQVPLVVVCGLGNDSRRIARHLRERGFDASSIAGGMVAWMRMALPRELEAPPGVDRLIQFDRLGIGALGYVLVSGGEALVVDPSRHTGDYLRAIAASNAKLVGVADTHAHADYISGGPALAAAHGVPYYLHPADAVYPYDGTKGQVRIESLADGAKIRVGRVEVEVRHTPGHTEGSVTYRLGGHFALTGDFIFVRSVGRPDLGGKTEEWASVLWGSLVDAKRSWPDGLAIYPAHYASNDERRADSSIGATFGALCRDNEPLGITDAGAFKAWVLARTGKFPATYRRIKAINLGLETVDDVEAEELEAGKNECALG
jgi:glyoxylase-like metal-dependent hydrolase (beta-lactamase superfamily II)